MSGGIEPIDVILRIAEYAEAMGWQAGVGGMETAGGMVSYLAAHPEDVDALMSGELSLLDWPERWHMHGRLTWHGQDGKIYDPTTARQKVIINGLAKSGPRP